MSKTKHSPGPWWVERRTTPLASIFFIHGPDTSPSLEIATIHGAGRIGTAEADANLIAAAPEMLAALRGIEPYMEFDEALEDYDERVRAVFAAIAKATGREPESTLTNPCPVCGAPGGTCPTCIADLRGEAHSDDLLMRERS